MSNDKAPKPDVLDLDALEREGGDKPPFLFKIEGEQFSLADPASLDYRDLLLAFRSANVEDFETALRTLLPEDDRDDFFELKIPAWKLEKLFSGYVEHFGLSDGGPGGRGKSRSSRRR